MTLLLNYLFSSCGVWTKKSNLVEIHVFRKKHRHQRWNRVRTLQDLSVNNFEILFKYHDWYVAEIFFFFGYSGCYRAYLTMPKNCEWRTSVSEHRYENFPYNTFAVTALGQSLPLEISVKFHCQNRVARIRNKQDSLQTVLWLTLESIATSFQSTQHLGYMTHTGVITYIPKPTCGHTLKTRDVKI